MNSSLLSSFLITIVVLIFLDVIYLSFMSEYMNRVVMKIQGKDIKLNLLSVFLIYILISLGLNYFILERNRPIIDAFLFGIIVYGVFDLTNYSLFEKWDILTVIIDTLWGGILFSLTTLIVYKLL